FEKNPPSRLVATVRRQVAEIVGAETTIWRMLPSFPNWKMIGVGAAALAIVMAWQNKTKLQSTPEVHDTLAQTVLSDPLALADQEVLVEMEFYLYLDVLERWNASERSPFYFFPEAVADDAPAGHWEETSLEEVAAELTAEAARQQEQRLALQVDLPRAKRDFSQRPPEAQAAIVQANQRWRQLTPVTRAKTRLNHQRYVAFTPSKKSDLRRKFAIFKALSQAEKDRLVERIRKGA
ncbi:MAG: DUF3106 domain-containing protein, partial [Bacteriovoracia bacterium]